MQWLRPRTPLKTVHRKCKTPVTTLKCRTTFFSNLHHHGTPLKIWSWMWTTRGTFGLLREAQGAEASRRACTSSYRYRPVHPKITFINSSQILLRIKSENHLISTNSIEEKIRTLFWAQILSTYLQTLGLILRAHSSSQRSHPPPMVIEIMLETLCPLKRVAPTNRYGQPRSKLRASHPPKKRLYSQTDRKSVV